MNPNGVVVTGIGIMGSLGLTRETFWKNYLAGESGIKPIAEFTPIPPSVDFGGEIRGFKPKDFLSPLVYRKMGRSSRISVVASLEALQDSGLAIDDANRDRIGVIVGTGYGNSGLTDAYFVSFMEEGPAGANPLLFADTVPNTAGSHISLHHRLRGPITTFCQNLISAEPAVEYACRLLLDGRAEAMLVGGVDELSPILLHAFSAVQALNPSPEPIVGRGMILGEGACVLVLERRDAALARKAPIYGEIAGAVLNSGVTRPGHFEAEGRSLRKAVRDGLDLLDGQNPDLISLSANFSKELDSLEYQVLQDLFGASLPRIPLTAMKYFAGEYAGSGALRLALLLLSIRDQAIPPSINPEELIPGTPWNRRFTPSRPGKVEHCLMTGVTFGGGNACLAVKKT